MKILINNEEESVQVQKALLSLGYEWNHNGKKVIGFVFYPRIFDCTANKISTLQSNDRTAIKPVVFLRRAKLARVKNLIKSNDN